MKTEREIREYRDSLKTLFDTPCNCAGTAHGEKCRIGGAIMDAVENALSWVLGEGDAKQGMVDAMNEGAASIRRHTL